MSIHQGRVGLRGPPTHTSACAPLSSVHPSGPRRPPRLVQESSRISLKELCPSIRAASASAARFSHPAGQQMPSVHPSGPRRPPRRRDQRAARCADGVSIHQGRVGLRGHAAHDETSASAAVSIHQGRVGLRGPDRSEPACNTTSCPSIRAASASAACQACVSHFNPSPVSIHQGRVGLRGVGVPLPSGREGAVSIHQGRVGLRGRDHRAMRQRRSRCPSIRAASASAASAARVVASYNRMRCPSIRAASASAAVLVS